MIVNVIHRPANGRLYEMFRLQQKFAHDLGLKVTLLIPYDFFFDASTTVVTRGKLEMYNKMDKPIPTGWAVNKAGESSNSANEVLGNIKAHEGGGIVPLGGDTEQLGGHKGYGYGMLCELFASILSQGNTSAHTMQNGFSGICHGFMAINPAFFGDPEAIKAHFSQYLTELRESPKADGAERIYTHGEKEMEAVERVKENGIPVPDYVDENVSIKVVKIIQSYTGIVNKMVWRKDIF